MAQRAAAVARALSAELGPGVMVEIVTFGRVATRVAAPDIGPAHATIAARDKTTHRVRAEGHGVTVAQDHLSLACAEPVLYSGSVVAVVSAWFPDRQSSDDSRRLVELAAIGLGSWWGRQEQQREYELAWTVDAGRARDQERRRLAYDLHGSVAQELAAARVSVDSADAKASSDPRSFARALAAARSHIHAAQVQTRRLIDALGARAVEDQGLMELVEGICREYESKLSLRGDTRVTLVASDIPNATSSVLNEAVAFVLREALQNVYEHAHAKRVEIAVARGKGSLVLTVTDDGQGFREVGSGTDRLHMGLSGIRERIHAVGGSISFESQDGQGARITAAIPI